MRGGALPALRAILGHRSLTMTMPYAHLSPGHLRTEIEKTAAQINAWTAHEVESDRSPRVSA
jgi:hypothetical protein